MIVKNEEMRAEKALSSSAWADEIIVVDSGSTDGTVALCRRYTEHVYEHVFVDYAAQKNYALSMATGEWVFFLDADEEITPELRAEITATLESPSVDGYTVLRRSVIFGREFRYSGLQHDRPLRLFRKKNAYFEGVVHERAIIQGRARALECFLIHRTYRDLSDYLHRFNVYTSMEAEGYRLKEKSHQTPGFFEFASKPLLSFLRQFLFQKGFRDGMEGFLFCFLSSFYIFVKHAKQAENTQINGGISL
jgi:glycosyltransferase involved in cell wall biosynthesis